MDEVIDGDINSLPIQFNSTEISKSSHEAMSCILGQSCSQFLVETIALIGSDLVSTI